MKRLFVMVVGLCMVSGCAGYKNSGWYAPQGVNYTLSRDRQTGDLTDYFGVTWSFK